MIVDFRTLEEVERHLSESEKEFIKAQAEIAHSCGLTIHKIAIKEHEKTGNDWERHYQVPKAVSIFAFDKNLEDAIDNLRTLSNIIKINSDSWLDPEFVPKKPINLEY